MQPMPVQATLNCEEELLPTTKETHWLIKNYYIQALESAPPEGWNCCVRGDNVDLEGSLSLDEDKGSDAVLL